ncbi:helix-turn-helix domain-containing protein [Galbitalea soli]|uniref:Helix-turn-helix domain-containing protein n=1 Tax=Galbitalea soli TaxID=1268042 RepID=A0A7C9PP12_9MICO|nr:helix-turn-helix domain-containing protein [Galbitalea soli]NEM91967.1 helix-turn-helix domain-containing protein [Galbitalea soli]NYJ32084.1 excisionase family DNA binding protein [Galbitalea soli]
MDAITRTASIRKTRTYLPDRDRQQELVDFANVIQHIEEYLAAHSSHAALVDPEGNARPIPDEIFRALEQVANALANGNGVTVAPYRMLMTTQQAADFLGISRPTFVKLLEQREIAFELRGRHRKVALRDVVDYQERFRRERGAALDALAHAGQDSVTVNSGPPILDRKGSRD